MTMGCNIALMSAAPETIGNVELALGHHDSGTYRVTACRSMDALIQCLEDGGIYVAVVDIDGDPRAAFTALEPMSKNYSSTRFVLLTSTLDNQVMRSAVQAGLHDIQPKETLCEELGALISRLVATAEVDEVKSSAAITVLSASGGCGGTTLVVNLANELQLTASKPVLVLDLDYNYGAVASYLELSAKYGIADVLRHDGDIDAQLISATAIQYADNLRALISPASINVLDDHVLSADRISEILRACRLGHEYTLIDAPRVSIEVATQLADASDVTLVVFQPMVKDIRVTNNLLKALKNQGISSDKLRPIMNRSGKHREMVSLDEAREALSGINVSCLSDDYTSAIRVTNLGNPSSNSVPRSALGKEIVHLAAEVSHLNCAANSAPMAKVAR